MAPTTFIVDEIGAIALTPLQLGLGRILVVCRAAPLGIFFKPRHAGCGTPTSTYTKGDSAKAGRSPPVAAQPAKPLPRLPAD
jgi:hypothetical protein